MATKKSLTDSLRARYISLISDFLKGAGEEVLVTASNEIAIPVVDDEQNEEFLVLTFKVPTGSRDGEPYDGYIVAQDFADRTKAKAEKAKAAAEEKAKKVAKDKKLREAKAELKAKRENSANA